MWLLRLICLFHFLARTLHANLWLHRLRSLGVNPFSHTLDYSEIATVVYLKMPFHELTVIGHGCTSNRVGSTLVPPALELPSRISIA